MKLWSRLSAAASLVFKGGTPFPFNVVPADSGGLTPDRLQQPYAQSVWVQSAIRAIANPIAQLELEFYAAGTETPVTDPRLAAFWRSPVRHLSRPAFLRASIGWRKLAGECFWVLDDAAAVPFPEARAAFPPLILARPDRMRHVVADGALTGWEFTDGRGRRFLLTPEQVIHLKQWNPYDEFRGLGEYEAACLAAETDTASGRFQRSLAQANGDQGVYVVAKSGLPDDAQKRQIVAQLREKRALQQRGIFTPVFLGGDLSIEDPQVRVVDAAFLEGRRMSATEIYVAFGVPPSMTKESASYSIGSASDYYRLILDTCQPEAAELAAGMSRVASVLAGRELEAWLDWDEHPVMQAVRKERLEAADRLWTKGMPMKLVGDYLNLGLPRFEGDEAGYLPFGLSRVADLAPLEAQPSLQEPADLPADPVQEALRVLRAPRCQPAGRAPAAEAAQWRTHMARRRPLLRSYETAFTRVLFAARAEVLRKLQSAGSAGRGGTATGHQRADSPAQAPSEAINAVLTALQSGHQVRAGAADFLFDLTAFRSALQVAFRKVALGGLNQAGGQLFAELGKDDPFTYPPEKAIQFLKARENRLSEVGDDIYARIKAVLEDGLNAGDGEAALAELVRGEFNELSRSRAATIASTETAAVYGEARQEGMAQAGVGWKKWLTSGGDNVREAHRQAGGQIVAVDETFTVGGEALRFPGDPHGSAGNVINCHCVAVAVATGPEENA